MYIVGIALIESAFSMYHLAAENMTHLKIISVIIIGNLRA